MEVIEKIREISTRWEQLRKIIIEEERCTICKEVKKCIYINDSEYEGAPICVDCIEKESEIYQFIAEYIRSKGASGRIIIDHETHEIDEIAYVKVTNKLKVSIALQILKDVLPGDEYGITKEMYKEIINRLSHAQDELFASYELV